MWCGLMSERRVRRVGTWGPNQGWMGASCAGSGCLVSGVRTVCNRKARKLPPSLRHCERFLTCASIHTTTKRDSQLCTGWSTRFWAIDPFKGKEKQQKSCCLFVYPRGCALSRRVETRAAHEARAAASWHHQSKGGRASCFPPTTIFHAKKSGGPLKQRNPRQKIHPSTHPSVHPSILTDQTPCAVCCALRPAYRGHAEVREAPPALGGHGRVQFPGKVFVQLGEVRVPAQDAPAVPANSASRFPSHL